MVYLTVLRLLLLSLTVEVAFYYYITGDQFYNNVGGQE